MICFSNFVSVSGYSAVSTLYASSAVWISLAAAIAAIH